MLGLGRLQWKMPATLLREPRWGRVQARHGQQVQPAQVQQGQAQARPILEQRGLVQPAQVQQQAQEPLRGPQAQLQLGPGPLLQVRPVLVPY